jgi:hypothetical protein
MKRIVITKTMDLYSYEGLTNLGSTINGSFSGEGLPLAQALDVYLDSLKTPTDKALDYIIQNATNEEKISLIDFYPEYQYNYSYKLNEEFKYSGKLYKVVQAHVSQTDWIPDTTPALYTEIAPAGVIPDWKQPIGAQDAYAIGAIVMFEGSKWESLVAANVWSPTAYPAGWKLLP